MFNKTLFNFNMRFSNNNLIVISALYNDKFSKIVRLNLDNLSRQQKP
jgi:hypothetical protein